MAHPFTAAACTLALLAAPLRADVISIDLDQGDVLQDTIDAAAPGDTILIQGGPSITGETAVINGKGLTLIGDDLDDHFGPEFVLRRLAIRNLPADQTVTIVQAEIGGPGGAALILTNNDGPVRFVDVSATGGNGLPELITGQVGKPGHAGALIDDSHDVTFVRCGLRGGIGGDVASDLALWSTQGGPGLEVSDSTVVLFASGIQGGRGGEVEIIFTPSGAPGGHGAVSQDSTLHLHNCSIQGGDAGEFNWTGSELLVGGDGLVQSGAGSLSFLRDTSLAGGEGNFAPDGQPSVVTGGLVQSYPDAMGRFEFWNGRVVREGDPLTISARDLQAGTQFFVLLSIEPGFLHLPSRQGVLAFDAPFASDLLLLGTSPAPTFNNLINLPPAPQLPGGLEVVQIMAQCIELPSGGAAVLGEPDLLTILDSEL